MKMYYTYSFAYNTPVPEAFTTIRKRAVLHQNTKSSIIRFAFTTIRKCAVLHHQTMALQTTKEF